MATRGARANRRCDGDGTAAHGPAAFACAPGSPDRATHAGTIEALPDPPPLDSSRIPADSPGVLPTRSALTLARRLAALAGLVLALGLPRFFVLCSAGGDELHLEFMHAPGACCEAAMPALADAPTDGSPALAAHEHCDHVSLTIEITPAPRGGDLGNNASALLAIAPLPLAAVPAIGATAFTRPAATGPPPWASRLRQQATVRLQV